MPQIVCVHGIGQQLSGPETLAAQWCSALRDGMRLAGATNAELPSNASIGVAFYGDIFRGRKKGTEDAPFELPDIEQGMETDLLMRWATDAGVEEAMAEDGDGKSGWTPLSIQKIATALLRRKFFARMTDRAFVGALKQVRWYLTEPETRRDARQRVATLLSPETRLVIGHSLGSIVAYEVLCQLAFPVHAFISLGSPIGLPNLIFERLDPVPTAGRGVWPTAVATWTNVADKHDIVAGIKELGPLFGGEVRDILIDNEALAHDVSPYFTAAATGKAVLDALRTS